MSKIEKESKLVISAPTRPKSKEPVKKNQFFSDEYLSKIPKTDLHVPFLKFFILNRYILTALFDFLVLLNLPKSKMVGFQYTTAVLQTASALERISYEFAVDNFEEGTRYFEVRFAPQLHVKGHDLPDICSVIRAVYNGLQRAREEYNSKDEIKNHLAPSYEFGIIVCAMRYFNEYFSKYFAEFIKVHQHESESRIRALAAMSLVTAAVHCRDSLGLPIVAFDLAGAEKGYPAEDYRDAFEYAQLHFFPKTVHAGEGYGPDSIFQAISKLYAQRIGHGFHLFSTDLIHSPKAPDLDTWADQLVNFVAENRITVEVCLSSNLQTMPELEYDMRNHAFRRMLNSKLSVVIGTDNRTVSSTNVTKELRLAVDAFCLSPKELRDIVINGFKRSFFHSNYVEKRKYVRTVIQYYDKLEKEYGILEAGRGYIPDLVRQDTSGSIVYN